MNKKMKCYISTDSTIDLSKVEILLHKLNVDTHNFYDFSIGSSFSDLIKRKIRESDFVLALITNNNQNVLFELGVAEALGKPVFLLVAQNLKLPFFLEGKMLYQLDWSKSTQLLELSLKNYIQDISNHYSRHKKKTQKETPNLTIDETNKALISLRKFRKGEFKEYDLINVIMDVFKKINVQAVSELALGDKSRVDIAITNEGLSSYFGNPLLIEVKSGRIDKKTIDRAQQQLQNYISKADANFGILLYFDKDDRRFILDTNKFSNILMFDIEDFVQGISSEGFGNFLLIKRNEFVHALNNIS